VTQPAKWQGRLVDLPPRGGSNSQVHDLTFPAGPHGRFGQVGTAAFDPCRTFHVRPFQGRFQAEADARASAIGRTRSAPVSAAP
jgi:hypothetical protein